MHAWYFYYGPIPLHNRMDTYCAINRAEWAIPWNNGVLQFKKGLCPPPPLFALYVRSVGQMGVHRARWVGQTGCGTSPGPPSQSYKPAPSVGTFQARCGSFWDFVSVNYGSKSKPPSQTDKWINI
jgi:hypothetical protein